MGITSIPLNTRLHKKTMCMVFGQGLIGYKISQQLSLYRTAPVTQTAINWTDSDMLVSSVSHLQSCGKADHIEVVWSAGRGGFFSSEAEMRQEFNTYKKVIKKLNENKKGTLVVSLISSAGGLYEGQRFIDKNTTVTPRRPYGVIKYKQEQLLAQLAIPHRIYRVASAYGIAQEHSRVGLVNALLLNSKIGRTTQIFANPDTFRDYVLNTDIARLVAGDICFSRPGGTQIICTGRATSIHTLINLIKQMINRKVNVNYVSIDDNDEDMVFSNKIVPSNLVVSTLEEGILLLAASQHAI
jgi:UDP-glucose 4-epimerase